MPDDPLDFCGPLAGEAEGQGPGTMEGAAMAASRIVCVETAHPHRHITHVGVGADPDSASERLTVMQVRSALRNGRRFYTVSPSTGRAADVEPYDFHYNGQVIYTIRSAADAIADNNLDNLRTCSWRSS